jgi:hypothetical protein
MLLKHATTTTTTTTTTTPPKKKQWNSMSITMNLSCSKQYDLNHD